MSGKLQEYKVAQLFDSLEKTSQVILSILGLQFAPISRTKLLDLLSAYGLKRQGNRKFSLHTLKPITDNLLAQGLLDELGQKRLACPSELLHLVCNRAVASDEFERMVYVIQSCIPAFYTRFGSQYYYDDIDLAVRDLRLALFGNDEQKYYEAEERAFHWFSGQIVQHQLVSGLAPDYFNSAWFEKFSPRFRLDFVARHVDIQVYSLSVTRPLIDHYQHLLASLSIQYCSPMVTLMLFQGRSAEIKTILSDPETSEHFLQLAWAEMIDGEYEQARHLYETAYKLLTASTRKRNIYFDNYAGIIATMAAMANPDQNELRVLHSRLKKGSKQKDNIYSRSIVHLLNVLELHLGMSDKIDHYEPMVHGLSSVSTGLLPYLLNYQWSGRLEPGDVQEPLKNLITAAEESGLHWLAEEAGQFLKRVGGEAAPQPCRYLVDVIQPLKEWERVLMALNQIGAEPEKAVGDARPVSKLRMVWLLDWLSWSYADELYIEPREQKCNASGNWSKGRPIALKRLYNEPEGFPYLSDQDISVCKTLERESSWGYGYSEDNYFFNTSRALPLLAGHPLLFLKDSPGTSAELQSVSPELTITRESNTITLRLIPEFDVERTVNITRLSPTEFQVIELNNDQRRIAKIIGKGLVMPEQAEEGIRQVINRIAPTMTIHSDIGVELEELVQTEADQRPYMHILPLDQGLSFELFMHPFGIDGPGYTPGVGSARLIAQVDGQRQQINRSIDAEYQLAEQVIKNCTELEPYQIGPYRWDVDHIEPCLATLEQLMEVQQQQVQLVWPQGEKIKLRGSSDFRNLALNARSNGNWFEVEGQLQVDDRLVLTLKQLLSLNTEASGRFVTLETGEILALSDALKKQLDDISGLLDSSADELRVHPLLIGALDKVGALAGEFSVDQKWQQQLERLEAVKQQPAELPTTLQAKLREYQLTGFNWLASMASWGAGACLADDMGLGKTLQSLSVILLRAPDGPTLVVAPTSVCPNWVDEIRRFVPTLNPLMFGRTERQRQIEEAGPYDVLICSYGLMQTEIELLVDKQWQTLVLDEAQAIKNPLTKRSRAAIRLNAAFRIALSGTPLENHLSELWSLFRFLNPGLLGTQETFNSKTSAIERGDFKAKNQLKRLIQPFILRRLKSDVLLELPEKTETTLHVEMSPEEMALYEALRLEALEQFSDSDAPEGQKRIQVLAQITRLRQACCNPALLAPELKIPSSKLKVFNELVDELLANGHKALVFSQFVRHLSLVRQALDDKGVAYQYLDGSTPAKRREQLVVDFQSGQGELFLISLKAGGTGLNLTAADYVIHLDPWWNPAVEDQASDRAHRIGQQRPVTVYRLVTRGTIEDKIVLLHQHKRDLAESLLEGTDSAQRLSSDEILALLKE